MKFIYPFLGFAAFLLSSCTTAPKPSPPVDDQFQLQVEAPPVNETAEQVIQRLGILRDAEDLGFMERTFTGCLEKLGADQVLRKECRNRYVTLVHFQLLCRDTDGTVSEVPANLNPIVSNFLRWQLGNNKGTTQTDERGYGQLRVISDVPNGGKRLIIHMGRQFFGLTVNEITRLILPKQWCT